MSGVLRIVAAVAGLYALVVGVWGIVVHDAAADSPGDITSAVMWIAIGITSLAVAVVALAVSQMTDR